MIRPKVPPMAVMIKMGAAVCMPFSTTSFKGTELLLSKRKESNMPITRAKLGEQSKRKKGSRADSFCCKGRKGTAEPSAIKTIGRSMGATAFPREGNAALVSSSRVMLSTVKGVFFLK